jgi:hypothetical protein
MSQLDLDSLKTRIAGLPDVEAAEILEATLRGVAEGDDFYFGNNIQVVMPVLVLLAHRDLDRADAVIDFGYRHHDRPYKEWIRETIHKEVRAARRRRALEALTPPEREAQLVLASLMPGGKPPDEAEQAALVLALLKDDPARACGLATQWWGGGYGFDDAVRELCDICWQSHPEELRILLGVWKGSGRDERIRIWTERLLYSYSPWGADQLVCLLELMGGGHYIDREVLLKVLSTLEGWPEEARPPVLTAMIPLWERLFPNLYPFQGVAATEVFLRLWKFDPRREARGLLDRLLSSRESGQRLREARQLKRVLRADGEVGVQFGYTLHAAAILARRGKKLSDYLNRKYIRPDHRRLWRSFLRGERLIQAIPDEVLRTRLLQEHAAIAKETRRARKGLILDALETRTDEPIRVVPEKGKK